MMWCLCGKQETDRLRPSGIVVHGSEECAPLCRVYRPGDLYVCTLPQNHEGKHRAKRHSTHLQRELGDVTWE